MVDVDPIIAIAAVHGVSEIIVSHHYCVITQLSFLSISVLAVGNRVESSIEGNGVRAVATVDVVWITVLRSDVVVSGSAFYMGTTGFQQGIDHSYGVITVAAYQGGTLATTQGVVSSATLGSTPRRSSSR